MRKWTLFLSILFLLTRQSAEAQCNPAFSSSISGSGASFTAAVTNTGFYHFWTFGDGFTGGGSSTSHIYNLPGTYQVKHIIFDTLGTCSDSSIQNITLNFTPVCHASFYSIYDSVNYSYGIYCYSNSNPSASQIRTYTWRVNNVIVPGNSSQLFFHPSPGTNTVCLTIESMAGCTDTYCQTFQVPPSCNLSPSFVYSLNPSNNHELRFTPSTSAPSLKYSWTFGDGYSSNLRQPVHQYYLPGTYLVKLTVNDSLLNCVDTVRQPVIVPAGPNDSCTANFSYTINNHGLAHFTAHSNQPVSNQYWMIYRYVTGDSVFIQAPDPTYQFIDTGHYLVCLTVVSNTGCTRTYCNLMYVGQVQNRYAEQIPAYPNPVTNGPVRFSLSLGRPVLIKISITDMMGNRVYTAEQNGLAGSNQLMVPTERLGKGQYLVEICYGYRINRSIFLKQ